MNRIFALTLCIFLGQMSSTVSPGIIGTTASIGGGALLVAGCTSGTITVAGAAAGMGVVVAPNTYPGDGTFWYGYVSSANTVTVKVCVVLALTPTASTYTVRVFH